MGGRTRTTELIAAMSGEYTRELNQYKEYAEKRRAQRKISQEFIPVMAERMEAYMQKQSEAKKPLTIAGSILALGISRDMFYRVKSGELDYVTEEYRALHADSDIVVDSMGIEYVTNSEGELIPLVPLSEALEKIVLLPLEDAMQSNCMSLRGNPAGNIFLLKAQMGYKEESEVKEVHQNLIIADREKATSILKMLGE